jgi:hypothetical protein
MTFHLVHETARARAIEAVRNAAEGSEVVIRPKKSKRSQQANSLYWVWLDRIRLYVADSTGQFYSAEALHEWFKEKFLPLETVEIAGEVKHCRRTTTKLTVAEMAEYMEHVDRFCIESLHLYLPQQGMEEI